MSLRRAIGLFLLLVGGFIALAFFDYAVAELLLETLKVFLSWPVITLFVLIYFLHSQGEVLSDVIARVTKLAFAGGEVVVAPPSYPSANPPVQESMPPITQAAPSASDEGREEPADPIQKLEHAFNNVLLSSFKRNKFYTEGLVNQIWSILMKGAFALTVKTPTPHSAAARAEAMKALLDIPDAVLSDLRRMETAPEEPSRDELVALYNKADALLTFFLRALASMRK